MGLSWWFIQKVRSEHMFSVFKIRSYEVLVLCRSVSRLPGLFGHYPRLGENRPDLRFSLIDKIGRKFRTLQFFCPNSVWRNSTISALTLRTSSKVGTFFRSSVFCFSAVVFPLDYELVLRQESLMDDSCSL